MAVILRGPRALDQAVTGTPDVLLTGPLPGRCGVSASLPALAQPVPLLGTQGTLGIYQCLPSLSSRLPQGPLQSPWAPAYLGSRGLPWGQPRAHACSV